MGSLLVVAILHLLAAAKLTGAYDPLDPTGNITINWDILQWTPDGYLAVVTVNNQQKFRPVTSPGWKLRWTWRGEEVIWNTIGAQTTEQGDCSEFGGNIPQSCARSPAVVDLPPGVPFNQQVANCCTAGELAPLAQDPPSYLSQFQVSVGQAGTTKGTVKLPRKFTVMSPGPDYACGPAHVVKPTRFISDDKRRVTQAFMTFRAICIYKPLLVIKKQPSCCVSLWSDLDNEMAHCRSCACGCGKVCPVHVRWRVNSDTKDHWGAEITITNNNRRKGYSYKPWNLVVEHPGLDRSARASDFSYKPVAVKLTKGFGMFYGKKGKNDALKGAGWVRSEVVIRKKKGLMLERRGRFPKKVYFNGDECELPRLK